MDIWLFDAIGTLAICGGTCAFFGLLFAFIGVLRWFRHREIVAGLEQGLAPVQHAPWRTRDDRILLGWGLGLAGLGVALVIGLLPTALVTGRYMVPATDTLGRFLFGPEILFGLVPLFIGLALLILYFATRQNGGAEKAREGQSEE